MTTSYPSVLNWLLNWDQACQWKPGRQIKWGRRLDSLLFIYCEQLLNWCDHSPPKKKNSLQIIAILMGTNVWGYCPFLQAVSSVQARERVWACTVCAVDELPLFVSVRWFIYHPQPCFKALTGSRVRLLFNLQTCCLKLPVDVISRPDPLLFIYFTFLPVPFIPKPSFS